MAFTRIKDVDLIILDNLNDKDLLNSCLTNKYVYEICDNNTFWYNRFIKRFGLETANRITKSKNWKNNYMKVIIDLDKNKNNYTEILENILWDPRGIEYSYFMEGKFASYNRKEIPLLQAPEQVLNVFFLLNLGTESIVHRGTRYESTINNVIYLPNGIPMQFSKIDVSNLTPYELFNKISKFPPPYDKYLIRVLTSTIQKGFTLDLFPKK